jgi:hypothetical protein
MISRAVIGDLAQQTFINSHSVSEMHGVLFMAGD